MLSSVLIASFVWFNKVKQLMNMTCFVPLCEKNGSKYFATRNANWLKMM